MKIYNIWRVLYPFFPREIGVKHRETKKILRRRVYAWHDVLRYVETYNGLHHLFISAYPLNNYVNKVVFDIDARNLEDALHTAQVIADFLRKEGVNYLAVFSGRKGFHVYAVFTPIKLDKYTGDALIRSFYSYVLNHVSRDIRQNVDTVLKNTNALIRLPNTLHPISRRWAVPLPDLNVTVKEVLALSSEPRDLSVRLGELRDLRDYAFVEAGEFSVPEDFGEIKVGELGDIDRYLVRLVRPCVVYYAHTPDADHFIRTTLAIELSWLDFTPEEQVKIFQKLGWSDFKYSVSMYHAAKIYEKVKNGELFPPSCRTLQERGYCLGKKCPFYPSVFYWWGQI